MVPLFIRNSSFFRMKCRRIFDFDDWYNVVREDLYIPFVLTKIRIVGFLVVHHSVLIHLELPGLSQ
ncbi:hypothetical protein [Marinilabilia sp.]|uniref:hypothetical protein n=1 Tax=Marinilabilia sp. TaxID=2021252 RepID=UPI0025BDFB33|nr:hypothetical protein [Marinilabilia sp.]